ncbi:MAG: N-acetylmuramoyl-L-alanine amidase [Syntrophaceae bacterium]|nr:N-acetylmuramoyl-L-alanine amidase [Syntrophaceae bacterium]
MKICIDPGHGGADSGAVGTEPFRLEEKDFNLSLALLLEEELEERGHWTIMTRRRDRSLSLPARANVSNRTGADLFVSIHANAAGNPAVKGMEVYHFPGSKAGKAAATRILDSLVSSFPTHSNRGVKEANFAVLRLTDMTAVLIETEFITNPKQLQFLADVENQKKMAAAIADGIEAIV